MAQFSENIGPCVIDWGGVELGETLGNTMFSFKESAITTKTEKTGTTARGKYISGVECKVTGAVTEATLAQLAEIAGQTATGDELVLKARVGANLIDATETVILKPIVASVTSSDVTDWIYIPKATIMPMFDVPHGLSDGAQKIWGFEIEGHPVLAADIVTGGCLFPNTEGWAANDIARLGKDS